MQGPMNHTKIGETEPVCQLAARVAPSAPQCAAAPQRGAAEGHSLPPLNSIFAGLTFDTTARNYEKHLL